MVLVIEDNPTDIFLVEEAVKATGLHLKLEFLNDGEAAIERIGSMPDSQVPQLILLDVNLPRTDGFQVLQYLRQQPRFAAVPVIVMTSSPSAADRAHAVELGASAYFLKPPGYDAFLKIGDLIRSLI